MVYILKMWITLNPVEFGHDFTIQAKPRVGPLCPETVTSVTTVQSMFDSWFDFSHYESWDGRSSHKIWRIKLERVQSSGIYRGWRCRETYCCVVSLVSSTLSPWFTRDQWRRHRCFLLVEFFFLEEFLWFLIAGDKPADSQEVLSESRYLANRPPGFKKKNFPAVFRWHRPCYLFFTESELHG